MKKETIQKSTGKSLEEWMEIIASRFPGGAPHKEIAAYLEHDRGLSPWWSQEVTVEYERAAGLRKVGETKDSGFQLGASKTFPVGVAELWRFISSPDGMELITGDRTAAADAYGAPGSTSAGSGIPGSAVSNKIDYNITTLKEGSHMRMKWKLPEWSDYSILQVRVVEKGPDKSTLTFHHEKLADKETREKMKAYWKEKLSNIAGRI